MVTSFGFLLKKVLSGFLIPPGLFVSLLLGLFLFFFLKRKIYGRAASALLLTLAGLMWLINMPYVNDKAQAYVEQVTVSADWPSADVIVVLGAGITDYGRPKAEMIVRLSEALIVQRKLQVPILITGGDPLGMGVSEAQVGKNFLLELGANAKDLIIEEQSLDTEGNAQEVLSFIHHEHPQWQRILLLTSAYHMKRSMLLFEKTLAQTKSEIKIMAYPVGFKGRPHLDSAQKIHNVYGLMAQWLPTGNGGLRQLMHENLGILKVSLSFLQKGD